jgi:RHS repeat-associated protein
MKIKYHENRMIRRAACLLIFLLCALAPKSGMAGDIYFYHNDNFGTPMAMTDINGEVVWRADELPFGEEYETIENPIPNNRRFLGKELDKESGLICMGVRFLDPKTGRFTQPDPVGLVDPATGKVNQEMLVNPQRQKMKYTMSKMATEKQYGYREIPEDLSRGVRYLPMAEEKE